MSDPSRNGCFVNTISRLSQPIAFSPALSASGPPAMFSGAWRMRGESDTRTLWASRWINFALVPGTNANQRRVFRRLGEQGWINFALVPGTNAKLIAAGAYCSQCPNASASS